MKELGIPKDKLGADDPRAGKPWCVFDPDEMTGGSVSTGIVIDSGVLNPDLLKGKKAGRIWPKARCETGSTRSLRMSGRRTKPWITTPH